MPTIRGSTALVLQDDRVAWSVAAGAVAVFASHVQDGAPAGPRRYLFTCRKGESLFGVTDGNGRDGYRLFAVGLEDSKLEELAVERVAEQLLVAGRAAQSAAVERWVEKITRVLVDSVPRVFVEKISFDDSVRLAAGQVVGPLEHGLGWYRVESGRVSPCGIEGIDFMPTTGVFPLGSDAWLHVHEPTVLRRVPPEELANAERLTSALQQLQRACLDRLEQVERHDLVVEVDRLSRRQQMQELDTSAALRELGAVLQRTEPSPKRESELMTALTAIGQQLGVTFREPGKSEDVRRLTDPIQAIARTSRVPMRRVALRGRWWRTDSGTLLGYLPEQSDKRPVALLRRGSAGYELFDPRTERRSPVTARVAEQLASEAVMFYRPFPEKVERVRGLAHFAFRPYLRDTVVAVVLSLAVSLLGMFIPQSMAMLIDHAISDANRSLILQMALVLLAVACGQGAFLLCQGIVMLRLQGGGTANLQAATWDRLLRLPVTFFRQFSSGDLLNRAMMVTEISGEISGTALRAIVTGFMSVIYLGLLMYYSAKLALIGLVVGLVAGTFTATLSVLIRRKSLQLERLSGSLSGFVVQVINGIGKLRVSGAEPRAYSQWARRYARQLRLVSGVQRLQNMATLFNFVVPTISTILLYYFAATSIVAAATGGSEELPFTMGTFVAFTAAFTMFIAGLTSASNTLVDIMDSTAKSKLVQPIFDCEPEVRPEMVDPGRLSGAVRLKDVTFRYRTDGPLILQDVNLHAEPGEYIALVGPSGSGKSTLFRLLLGFEKPEFGAILYDGQDLADLDVTAVRRQIGVVLQSQRISGSSIVGFITGGLPMALDEVWQVLREVGLADDVREMPMELHTVISEGGGNLSGGQRQRLVIARALALNPKILFFDEATSALDNRTQAIVSESVRQRDVTRIAIAHRLSTIRTADRIYVLERGHIAQVGSFDELANAEGLFQRMMARQMTSRSVS